MSYIVFFFKKKRRKRKFGRDWSAEVCSSDLDGVREPKPRPAGEGAPLYARVAELAAPAGLLFVAPLRRRGALDGFHERDLRRLRVDLDAVAAGNTLQREIYGPLGPPREDLLARGLGVPQL